MGSSISRWTKESYHYAMSCEITQAAWVKHGTFVRYLRPIDGYMVYTDINFEYQSDRLYHSFFYLKLN